MALPFLSEARKIFAPAVESFKGFFGGEEEERRKRKEELRKRILEAAYKRELDPTRRQAIAQEAFFGAEPSKLRKFAIQKREELTRKIEEPLIKFEEFGKRIAGKPKLPLGLGLPMEIPTRITTAAPRVAFQFLAGTPEERAEENRIALEGTAKERAGLFEAQTGRIAAIVALQGDLLAQRSVIGKAFKPADLKKARSNLGVSGKATAEEIKKAR